MIDGGENYDRGCGGCVTMMPSVDAIAEFNTITSNAPGRLRHWLRRHHQHDHQVRHARFPWRGYEFFRNDAMDANAYFANLNGIAKPELRYNIYGWNLGGPGFIPKLYNKDARKDFFFWNQEWRKFVIGTQIFAVRRPAVATQRRFQRPQYANHGPEYQ